MGEVYKLATKMAHLGEGRFGRRYSGIMEVILLAQGQT